jgi:hypothetical protein
MKKMEPASKPPLRLGDKPLVTAPDLKTIMLPKPVQRIRIRPCGLKMPALTDDKTDKVTFTCQLEKGHEGRCEEKGVVILDNGNGMAYQMSWLSLGPYEARRMRDRIK